MDNYLNQLSRAFLEPVKREQGRPSGFRFLDNKKNKTSKPHPRTQQNEISKVIPNTHKSQSTNKPIQPICSSSTSPNSTSSDAVKSLILKLNAAKKNQEKARIKNCHPRVLQNRNHTESESNVSVQSTSILERMFMSNKKCVSSQHVTSRKSFVEVPHVTSKSAIKASDKVASSSIKQILLSNSEKPALAERQPPRPVAPQQRSVEEPRVTPQIAMTGSSKDAPLSLEEWFMSNSEGRLQCGTSRRRSAEEARLTPHVPIITSGEAPPSHQVTQHHMQLADNQRKSVQVVGAMASTSEPYCKETHPSPVLTIRRLGALNRKAMAPNHQLIGQGHSGPQLLLRAKNEKSPNECKSRKFGGEEKDHPDDSEPLHTGRLLEGDQPPRKYKSVISVSARKTNAENTKESKEDNLQVKQNVIQTQKQKRKAGSKKTSKSSVLSKKRVLNNHSRSTQKTKQSRKTGLENIDVRSRKLPGKYSQRDVDPILKPTTKKITIHTTSKKNSNSHSQRGHVKSTKKGASKKSTGSKRAASSKDSHSQSRKRIRKSVTKSDNVASDEDDSGLQKSHSSGGSIFTLSELEHACNTLVPFSEIQQLEERLHHGPVATSWHVTGSYSSLGSILDARIHPGGIWKSIVDEG